MNWSHPNNLPLTGVRLKVMECPSTPQAAALDGAPPPEAWTPIVANGDYAGIYGVDPRLVSLGLIDAVSAGADKGAISKTQKLNFNSFTDGLSNTIQATESAGRPNVYRNGKLVVVANGNQRVNGGGWCRPASEIPLLIGSSADGMTFPGPAAINATNGEVLNGYTPPTGHPYYGVDGTSQIYSFHPGGVNALFADGSVRFLQQNVPIRTLAALVTRNGGEVNAGN